MRCSAICLRAGRCSTTHLPPAKSTGSDPKPIATCSGGSSLFRRRAKGKEAAGAAPRNLPRAGADVRSSVLGSGSQLLLLGAFGPPRRFVIARQKAIGLAEIIVGFHRVIERVLRQRRGNAPMRLRHVVIRDLRKQVV